MVLNHIFYIDLDLPYCLRSTIRRRANSATKELSFFSLKFNLLAITIVFFVIIGTDYCRVGIVLLCKHESRF